MTFALIIIGIMTIFYLLSLKLYDKKDSLFTYRINKQKKELELKRLRNAISKHTGISRDLIYSNSQIDQLIDARIKTVHDLNRMNLHHSIANDYGEIILKILT